MKKLVEMKLHQDNEKQCYGVYVLKTTTVWPSTPPPLLHSCRFAFILLVFTFKEQVGLGKVQLVTKACGAVLHPGVGFKFNSYLQLYEKI